MPAYFMGIDYGTGGCKACIIDEDLNVLSYAFREYPIITERPGWAEHDPALYWRYTCEIIGECLAGAKISSKEIKAAALSAAVPSLVLIDRGGNPINNAYNLMDRRAREEVRQIEEKIGKRRIFEVSGNRLEDHPVLVNLLWEKNNRPCDYARIYKAFTIDGYIRYRLTGESTFHLSAGLGYGVAYNMRTGVFDKDILDAIGIDECLLPRPTATDEVAGTVRGRGVECGLCEGTPIIGGQLDCNASWLGAGAVEEGDIQMNLGTVGNFGIIHRNTDFLDGMLVAAYTIDCKNTYITIPTTTTGGQTLRYIRDNFGQAERGLEKDLPWDAYTLLNFQAEKIGPGSGGLVVLPWLMGERSPLWDADARGVVFGLSLMHTKGHVIRAAMEGVAYALYSSFRIIRESGKKVNSPIVLNEGGAKSALWRKIITDVFNVPTVFCKNRAGAPFGDAVLAAVSSGFAAWSAVKEKAEYTDHLDPDRENHQLYMEYFDLFQTIYRHTQEDYKTLAAIVRRNY
jgi:xylulokinase